jgi:hypothetical protein
MYFGGSGGLTRFDPAHIRRNETPPPIVFTDLRLFNDSVPIGTAGSVLSRSITETGELTLSHRDAMVSFEFAALNFIAPQKNRYAYRLEGFDQRWNEVGNRGSATYTNLPDGDFTLRVRASNNDGVWNDSGIALRLRVTPPVWRTRWFLAGTLLAVGTAVALAHRARILRHLRVERELQRRVAEALAQIKILRGLLPICAWCRKVRDDEGYWSGLEEYVGHHTQAEFTHGICPDCRERMGRDQSTGSS